MTEDELAFLDEIYLESFDKNFQEWIEHMEHSYAHEEFSAFCD